jgi:hypothetical protein
MEARMEEQEAAMNSNQQPDKLDRILLEENALLPSSGFAASVMESIQEQAAEPAPIPFPWKLALPGIAALIAAAVVLIRLTVAAFQTINQGMDVARVLPQWYFDLLASPSLQAAATPVLLALAASAVCVLFCHKLARGWSA